MTDCEVEAAADALLAAERSRVQVPLLSRRHPEATIADAYRIQAAFVARKLAAGRRRIGWKIGLTSKAMQSALGIDTPDSGVVLDDMMFPDGATVPADRFIAPRVEAEIAFVMKAPLAGPGATIFDVLNATDFIIPALEILDSRVVRVDAATGHRRTIVDTVADNAANAGIAMGGRPMRPLDVDLRWIGAILSRNAEVEETGLGAGVLNHPATGIVWLANRLATFGEGLLPGEVVLSGSFVRPVEAGPGNTIVADYGPLGTVSLYFADR